MCFHGFCRYTIHKSQNKVKMSMKITFIKKAQYSFFDMEQLRETVKNSDIEHLQLSSGLFSGNNYQFNLPNSTVSTGCYTQKVLAQGTLPRDMLTFGIILNNVEAGLMLGQRFEQGELVFFPENFELHYLLPENTIWTSFNISRQFLAQKGFEISLDKPTIIRSFSQDFVSFYAIMKQLCIDETSLNAEEVENSLIECVYNILTIDTSEGKRAKKLCLSKQSRLLKQTKYYLHDNILYPVKVSEIVNELGCSHRSINYAFKDILNMTLKQYIQYIKLNRLRYLLQNQATENESIKTMAQSCGFSHMGRVAKEYGVLFAESPSQTKKLCSAKKE